ncbi:hypothetical protein F4781DRAFT_107503 [Annulohypoxylon bovei var. microspora]|nr:hypothetical protein F4781DRAFT_107503 [Annulohypoxylon bovei var. microspora]
MNVFTNIWKDVRLLNATVYAQWLCILSAIACVVVRICWLISADTPKHVLEKWDILIVVLDMIFFPLVGLAVELSHVTRHYRWPTAFACVYCMMRVCLDFIFSLAAAAREPSPFLLAAGTARLTAMFLGMALPFAPWRMPVQERRAEINDSIAARACFHSAFALALVYGAGVPHFAMGTFVHSWPGPWRLVLSRHFRVVMYLEPAAVLSGLASLAYWVALFARQEYVFSRTLGGPGVEVMTFLRPGRAPNIDSIGLEEGRIRLS